MNHSSQTNRIDIALAQAQRTIRSAKKDSENPHFRSKYADLAEVMDAVRVPLLDAGVLVLQAVEDSEKGVSIETRLIHVDSGQYYSHTVTIPVDRGNAQAIGSAITYGRRYGLMLSGVVSEE